MNNRTKMFLLRDHERFVGSISIMVKVYNPQPDRKGRKIMYDDYDYQYPTEDLSVDEINAAVVAANLAAMTASVQEAIRLAREAEHPDHAVCNTLDRVTYGAANICSTAAVSAGVLLAMPFQVIAGSISDVGHDVEELVQAIGRACADKKAKKAEKKSSGD
jgi:hypothetical protein